MYASSGARARPRPHDLHHVGEHQHGDVREQVVLRHVEQLAVVECREPVVTGVDAARAARSPRSQSRIVPPLGTAGAGPASRCSGCRRARPSPRRTPSQTVLVVGPVAQSAVTGARTTARACRAGPRPLRAVDVVAHRQHLAVDALYVVRLAEPVDERLPVARRGDRHRGGAPELVDPGPRGVVGHRRRGSRRGARRRPSRFTNTSGPHVSTRTGNDAGVGGLGAELAELAP